MPSLVDTNEGEVPTALDLTILVATDLERLHLGTVEVLLAIPDKLLSPQLVAEPVANIVGIASVNENGDLLDDIRDKEMERLGPITVEQECLVDVGVATLVILDFGTDSRHNFGLVKVLGNPCRLGVAKVLLVLALLANIVHVISRALEGTNHGVIAVNGTRNTVPHALRVVAALNKRLASGKGIIHGLAVALVQDRPIVAAIVTASHRTIRSILRLGISQPVTNSNALEVDVAVLVRQDLRCEDGDVVTSIGLPSDVEGLLGVLGEVVKEKSQKSVMSLLAAIVLVTDPPL